MEQVLGSQQSATLTAGADTLVMAGNTRRRTLVLAGAVGVGVYYGFAAMTAAGQGVLVGPNGPPLVLTKEMLGELVTYPVHAFCAAAPVVTVMEGTTG